jgi:hypothetical protein
MFKFIISFKIRILRAKGKYTFTSWDKGILRAECCPQSLLTTHATIRADA